MIYCLAETREESPEHRISFIISISVGVPLFAILVIGMIYLCKHGKLNKIIFWRRDAPTLEKTFKQSNQASEEKKNGDNDSLLRKK
jgi:hypothetical protein